MEAIGHYQTMKMKRITVKPGEILNQLRMLMRLTKKFSKSANLRSIVSESKIFKKLTKILEALKT